MHVIDIIILLGWVVFWVFWLAASFTAKAGKSRWGQFAGFRAAAILVENDFAARLRRAGSHHRNNKDRRNHGRCNRKEMEP